MLDQGDVDMLRDGDRGDFKDDPAIGARSSSTTAQPFGVGDRLVQNDLAKTLRADQRARAPTASTRAGSRSAIVASSQAGKGLITQADLDRYKTRELAPVECDYRGYHIVSAPPPSSGGVVICEILNILEGYPLKELGFHSAQAVHVQIEAMRHAYVDRNSYLGDPDFVKNPLDRLLDKDYAAKIRAAIDPNKAGDLARTSSRASPPHEGSNTTHYSIVDKDGNAVSVTYTLNDWFGAKVTAAEDRRAAERRDGRLHRQARRAEPVRPGAGRGQRDRAGQAAAVLDEPDHRHQGRQAGDGGRHARRQPHHHRGAADHHQRDRLRHERRRKPSTRRASTSNGCRI